MDALEVDNNKLLIETEAETNSKSFVQCNPDIHAHVFLSG